MSENLRLSLDEIRGKFWLPDTQEIDGQLAVKDNNIQLDLEGILQQLRTVRRKTTKHWLSVEYGGSPKDTVADYNPISIFGRLEDGRLITLLDARAKESPFGAFATQDFKASQVLMGAHATRATTRFQEARVTIPTPQHWPGLFTNSNSIEISLQNLTGDLQATYDGDIGWIQFSIKNGDGLLVQDFERRYWNRVFTILKLWTNLKIGQAKHIQLRAKRDDLWAELLSFNTSEATLPSLHKSLLSTQRLTLSKTADALSRFEELAPIPDIASRDTPYEMTIESALLANASCLEGLHHHCYDKSKPFPDISNSKTVELAKVAAQSAASKAVTLGAIEAGNEDEFAGRLLENFRFFNQKTFKERLDEILLPVENVAPGLIGPDKTEWINSVASARNHEAHRFAKNISDYDKRTDDYYQLAVSTLWVLRIGLLLQIGVPADFLRSSLHEHQKFLFALANMDNCKFPWPGSRYDTFRASKNIPLTENK